MNIPVLQQPRSLSGLRTLARHHQESTTSLFFIKLFFLPLATHPFSSHHPSSATIPTNPFIISLHKRAILSCTCITTLFSQATKRFDFFLIWKNHCQGSLFKQSWHDRPAITSEAPSLRERPYSSTDPLILRLSPRQRVFCPLIVTDCSLCSSRINIPASPWSPRQARCEFF